MASDHPAMVLARRGPKGTVDNFLAFWLMLLTEGRQARFEAGRRRTRRTVERFLTGRDVTEARELLGEDALAAELRDAAALYFDTCMTDPHYATTLFGTKRLQHADVVVKAAVEAAGALGVLFESGVLDGFARRLPTLLVQGFVAEVGEDSRATLRAAVLKNPGAAALVDVVDLA